MCGDDYGDIETGRRRNPEIKDNMPDQKLELLPEKIPDDKVPFAMMRGYFCVIV